MKDNMDREITKLLDKKNKCLSKLTENMDTISDQTKDSTELYEALRISKKQDNGENVSKQESEKLSDVKKHYESYFEDEDGNVDDSNITGGLNDAINSIKDDKLSLISGVNELRQKAKQLDKLIMEKQKKASSAEASDSTEMETNNKRRKTSHSDDSTEMETKGKQKQSSIVDDSVEMETMGKQKQSSNVDDSVDKVIKEKEKKSSLLDDYADTSLEMPEIIDD